MKLRIVPLTILFALFSATPTMAAQFGLALGVTDGDGEMQIDGITLPAGFPSDLEFDVETRDISFAFNACEGCRWFNYRLNAGYVDADLDYGRDPVFGLEWTDEAKGFQITNTFSLKLAKSDSFQLWIGPSIYLAALEVDGDVTDEETANIVGWGPTLGMDFRLPEGVTLSLELGTRDLDVDIDSDLFDDHEVDDTSLRFSVLF